MSEEPEADTHPAEPGPFYTQTADEEAAFLMRLNAAENSLTEALRENLNKMLDAQSKALPPEIENRLRAWIAEARIKNLAEWLTKERCGNWSKIDDEEFYKRLRAAEGRPNDKKITDNERISISGCFGFSAWVILNESLFSDKPRNWLAELARPWIKERAEMETERARRDARAIVLAIRPKATTDAGNEWTPLPRALELAAAMGGPFSVDVDGETYASEPELAGAAVGRALRPRAFDIVPDDWLHNPAQLTLALNMDPPDAVREYIIETAAKTAHLAKLPNICPKLLGFMFAAAPMTGRPVKGTLLELARWLYPDWTKNNRSTRDLQGLGAAFVAVKSLRLVDTKPDGTRHPYDLFNVDYDLSCKPDAKLGFMINPWLVERMKGGKGGGFFLLNMTRWLALGIQNPRLFPLALRLAALWDTARKGGIYDPAHLRPITSDRLAWECNTLSEGAAMYRAGKTDAGTDKRAGKKALGYARAELEADLNRLQKAGLLGPWEKRKVHGKGFTVLPVPPADYPEACKRAAQSCRKALPRRKG